jgi:hypothetical protein
MVNERGYQFLRINQRQSKPRTRGITEIRGPPTIRRWLAPRRQPPATLVIVLVAKTISFQGAQSALRFRLQ